MYYGTVATTSAFSFVGATYVTVDNMLFSSSIFAPTPPQVVVLLGRPTNCGSGGGDIFDNVSVEGYAQSAVVYSVGSEVNTWYSPPFILNGGGASYVYYQSNSDSLSLSLPGMCSSVTSDLSDWFIDPNITDYGPNDSTANSDIYLNGSQGGDDVFRDGYMSMASTTGNSAFTINSSGYGHVTIDSIRAEGPQNFVYVATSSAFSGLRVLRDTLATPNSGGTNYMVNAGSGVTLTDADIEDNYVYGATTNTSAFPTMANSQISENYSFTVATSTNSFVTNRSNGSTTVSGTLQATALIDAGILSQACIGTNSAGQLQASSCTASTTWSASGTILYYTGGNVGIGVTNPTSTVEVNGPVTSDRTGAPTQYLQLSGGTSGGIFVNAVGSSKPLFIGNSDSSGNPQGGTSIDFQVQGNTKMQIGGTAPDEIFLGATNAPPANVSIYQTTSASSSANLPILAVSPTSTIPSFVVANNTYVGIETQNPSTTLQVAGASSTIRIGNSSLPGCLEMGNSDGSAGINYVTFLNGVMTATTTKPNNCQ